MPVAAHVTQTRLHDAWHVENASGPYMVSGADDPMTTITPKVSSISLLEQRMLSPQLKKGRVYLNGNCGETNKGKSKQCFHH